MPRKAPVRAYTGFFQYQECSTSANAPEREIIPCFMVHLSTPTAPTCRHRLNLEAYTERKDNKSIVIVIKPPLIKV